MMEDILRAQRWLAAPTHRKEAIAMMAEATKRPASQLNYLFTKRDQGRDPNGTPISIPCSGWWKR